MSIDDLEKHILDILSGLFRIVRGINASHAREREIYHKLEQIEYNIRKSFIGNILSTLTIIIAFVSLILSIQKVDVKIIALFVVVSLSILLLITYGLSKAYHIGEVHRRFIIEDEIALTEDRIDQLKSERNMAKEILSKMELVVLSDREKENKERLKKLIAILNEEIKDKEEYLKKLKEM